jgi:hypothetical protein
MGESQDIEIYEGVVSMTTEKIVLNSIEECNGLLKKNSMFANGKNIRVTSLYETSAKSRWDYENLWGIYLAKPEFAWMALWIAITSRTSLRKRQIKYIPPQTEKGDYIGKISIYNPENIELEKIFSREAYIYLFNNKQFLNFSLFDISDANKEEKGPEIFRNGFVRDTVIRRGREYKTIVKHQAVPTLVDIDEWQVAVIGIPEIVPDIEVVITAELIKELESRITWSPAEVGEEYIEKS